MRDTLFLTLTYSSNEQMNVVPLLKDSNLKLCLKCYSMQLVVSLKKITFDSLYDTGHLAQRKIDPSVTKNT